MAYRPAYLWNGSGWDQVGDPRVGNLQTRMSSAETILAGRGQANGIATLDASSDIPAAQLSNMPGVYPLGEYGLGAASVHPDMCAAAQAAEAASRVGLYRTWIPAGVPINGLVMVARTAAATSGSGTLNRYVVYTDAGVLAGTTADDTSLFLTTGVRAKALTAAIAAQSTGRFVYLGFVHQYSTAPTHLANAANVAAANAWRISSGAVVTTANRRVQVLTAVTTALPSSFTPSATSDFPIPFIGAF